MGVFDEQEDFDRDGSPMGQGFQQLSALRGSAQMLECLPGAGLRGLADLPIDKSAPENANLIGIRADAPRKPHIVRLSRVGAKIALNPYQGLKPPAPFGNRGNASETCENRS